MKLPPLANHSLNFFSYVLLINYHAELAFNIIITFLIRIFVYLNDQRQDIFTKLILFSALLKSNDFVEFFIA